MHQSNACRRDRFRPGSVQSGAAARERFWSTFEVDVRTAEKTGCSVLISGPGDSALAFAHVLVWRLEAWRQVRLVVCDTTTGDANRVLESAPTATGPIQLLVPEVQKLSARNQANLLEVVQSRIRDPRAPIRRIITTSSQDLFGAVERGKFDDRLFYCLNTIHLVLPRDAAMGSSRRW